MIQYIKKFPKNTIGKDYVVGDIHGMFTLLENILESINFNPETDRLFSVGDLCDRGADSYKVSEWLKKEWFFPVFGNHEEIFLLFAKNEIDYDSFIRVGGKWAFYLSEEEIKEIAKLFAKLPLAIEVETDIGKVGIIHADCPVPNWNDLNQLLNGRNGEEYYSLCLWSHNRVTNDNAVQGIDAVVVGHMTQPFYNIKGNVHMIDTGAVYQKGYFTILDLNTLQPLAIEF